MAISRLRVAIITFACSILTSGEIPVKPIQNSDDTAFKSDRPEQSSSAYHKEGALDIELCENEPLAFIGSLQSDFSCAIFCGQTFKVLAHTEDFYDVVGLTKSQTLMMADIIDLQHSRRAQDILKIRQFTSTSLPNGNECEFRIANLGNAFALILKPNTDEQNSEVSLDKIISLSKLLEQNSNCVKSDLRNIFETVASTFREISGYDRVMIYEFDIDWNGTVVAEQSNDKLTDRFIGLTFPSSDIPKPARDLFLTNRTRVISDVKAPPKQLFAVDRVDVSELNLSNVPERAVSPVHLQYLANMGVSATLNNAIVVENKLWGLLTCHHYSGPKQLSRQQVELCQVITGLLNNFIRHYLDNTAAARSDALYAAGEEIRTLIQNADHHRDLSSIYSDLSGKILSNLQADGCLISVLGEKVYLGQLPSSGVDDLESCLLTRAMSGQTRFLATSHFSGHYPDIGNRLLPICAGVLFHQSRDQRSHIIAWRNEAKLEETWAGDPNKMSQSNGRLSPRASFELWKGEQKAKSEHWPIESKTASSITLLALREGTWTLERRKAEYIAEEARKRAERVTVELEYAAMHDSLTGLPNRRFMNKFVDLIKQNLIDADRGFAILHIDLDGFKLINDTLGHAAGDQLLKYISGLIQLQKLEGDFVARVGGDEFVLVVQNKISERDLAERCEAIIDAINEPYYINGERIYCGASIGVAYEGKTGEIDALLRRADIALYEAKRQGKNRYCFITDDLEKEQHAWRALTYDVRRGYEAGEFCFHFQLQFDSSGKEVTGAEALIRWEHPTKGLLTPGYFLTAAEHTGILDKLFKRAIADCLELVRFFKSNGVDLKKVGINVSTGLLSRVDVDEIISEFDGQLGVIALEILEASDLDNLSARVRSNIEKFRSAGVRLEVDDFGTGHTSIVGLLNVSPDVIKIAKKLTETVAACSRDYKLLKSIVDIAKNLNMGTIAEGVETHEQVLALRQSDCDNLQGYLFSLPQPMSMALIEQTSR